MIKGLDISKYQGDLSFIDVKNNFEFIIIKSTEGNGYIDPKFKTNQVGLRNVGICLGYYHFARPDLGNTPVAEADWFLKTIGTLKEGEILCLDYEANWNGDVVNWCYEFLNRVFSITGIRPLIYLNQSLVKGKDWTKIINENFGLWLAVYDYDPNKACPSTPWPMVTIKQYSNKLPFGSLAVDGDVFYGDVNAFKTYGIKFNNSNTNMTQEQTNIMNYIMTAQIKDAVTNQLRNITEGDVRRGIGYITDNIDAKVTKLEQQVADLKLKIKELTSSLTSDGKTALDWQKEFDSASAEIQTWKKKSLQASSFRDIVNEIINRLLKK